MWRTTARMPRFFGLDVRSLLPVAVWMFYMRWWTFYVALIGIAIFFLIERRGYTPIVMWRVIRLKLMGKWRPPDEASRLRYRLRMRKEPHINGRMDDV